MDAFVGISTIPLLHVVHRDAGYHTGGNFSCAVHTLPDRVKNFDKVMESKTISFHFWNGEILAIQNPHVTIYASCRAGTYHRNP